MTLNSDQTVTFAGGISLGALSTSGNLTFTGTGNRITGDFSNATVANRVMFQTSTANSYTVLGTIPNGTGTLSGFLANSGSDTANTSLGSFIVRSDSSELRITSGIAGTGTYFPTTFYTGGTERVRIDTSGNLALGTGGGIAYPAAVSSTRSSIQFTSGNAGIVTWCTDTGGQYQAIYCNGATITRVGSVLTTGSSTAYNTSSDYRLKENVQPMAGALTKVASLKPVTYTWKSDGTNGQGFIAHELQEHFPDAVHGEKDAVDADGNIDPQGVDTSFLVATLTAAIQELKAELDAAKADIATLKGAA
jgi:hypothetical protein